MQHKTRVAVIETPARIVMTGEPVVSYYRAECECGERMGLRLLISTAQADARRHSDEMIAQRR